MKSMTLNKIFILCFASVCLLFTACSNNDNDSDDAAGGDDFVEIPSGFLGEYEGALSFEEANTGFRTATLVRTGNKTYAVNLGDDVPSFEDIKFVEYGSADAFETPDVALTEPYVRVVLGAQGQYSLQVLVEDFEGRAAVQLLEVEFRFGGIKDN